MGSVMFHFFPSGGGLEDKDSENLIIGFVISSESGHIWSHPCIVLSPPVQRDLDRCNTTVVIASGEFNYFLYPLEDILDKSPAQRRAT